MNKENAISRKKTRIYLKILLSFFLTCGLVLILWRYVDTGQLLTTLHNVDLRWLPALFVLFYAYQYLRVLRLETLSDLHFSKKNMIHTLSLQSFLNSTLPAGLGELSLVYILQRFHQVDWRQGTSSAIIARLWDLSIFAVLFLLLVCLSSDVVPQSVYPFMIALTAVLALAISGLIAFVWLYSRITVNNSESLKKIWQHAGVIIFHLKKMGHPSKHIKIFIYTLTMWILMYLVRVVVLYSLNFDLGLLTVFWIYIIPIELLPIKGIANIGTFEAASFIVLKFLGHSESLAANIAFGSHMVILAMRASTALISCLCLFALSKKAASFFNNIFTPEKKHR